MPELTLGRGLVVGHNTVKMLMRRAGLKGLPNRRRPKPRHHTPTAVDLVDRNSARPSRGLVDRLLPDRGAGHERARYGRFQPVPTPDGTAIHSDHSVQFTSWTFTRRAKESGLVPSMGTIGDCYDNAVIESSRGRVQTELLNRRRWQTRLELANALFEYFDIVHNRRRRHTALGMLAPAEYELLAKIDPVA